MTDPVVQIVMMQWLIGVAFMFGLSVVSDMKRDWLASTGAYLP